MSEEERNSYREFSIQVIRNNDILKERLRYLRENTPEEIGMTTDDIIIEREMLQNLLIKRQKMYDYLMWYYSCIYKNKIKN